MRDGDTIIALSSGAVPSGVAIIRISGPLAARLIQALAGALPAPRRLTLRDFRSGEQLLDKGLVVWFPAPHSFTGEDCAELHTHGSPAIIRALLRVLAAEEGARLAEAGEFTRRAFENGKLDLTEVEGLGDLIEAETEAQRRQALARLDGELSRRVESWRLTLLDLRAEIEARLDFSDEGDVDGELPLSVETGITGLREEMRDALASLEHGRVVRDGFRVAIAGPPNAGKSSLLNALSKSDVAIVSDEPGTTRDVREVALDLGGMLVILIDMAGLRQTESKAELEGVKRARAEIARADLTLWLTAPDVPDSDDSKERGAAWVIGTKADLGPAAAPIELAVSSTTGGGIGQLLQRLGHAAAEMASGPPALLSRERDREAIEQALIALGDADLTELELAAEALRGAGHALAWLVGRLDAEMVLDRLFASFCIGK